MIVKRLCSGSGFFFAILFSVPMLSCWSKKTTGPLFIQPSAVDVGFVVPRSTKDFWVEVENRGDQALVLSSLRGSCSCTVIDTKTLAIPAQKTGKFRVSIRFAPAEGNFDQAVAFDTNDKAHPSSKVQFKGTIESVIGTFPERVSLYSVPHGSLPLKKEIAVTFSAKRGVWTETSVKTSDSYISAVLNAKNPSSATANIVLTQDAPSGEIDSWIEIAGVLDGKRVEKLVPIGGSIIGNVAAEPSTVFLSKPPSASEEVLISIAGELDITKATTKLHGDRINDQIEVIAVNSQTLLVKRKTTGTVGRFRGNILILEENSNRDILSIPIYGF